MSEEEENDGLLHGGKIMSLFGHLAELRTCLIKSIFAILLFFCVCLFYSSNILNFLKQPLLQFLPEAQRNLHYTGPLDVFTTSIKVSMLSALVLAAPVWMYQFWRFLEPALYPKERRFALPFVMTSVLLFFFGILFCFFGILPMALEFLLAMGNDVGTPIITVTDYISLVSIMIFGFGAVFEAPLILILLSFLGLVHSDSLRKYRREMIVVSLIIGAILTPPDPVSQIAMAVPLYIMYEIAIVVIRFLEKRRKVDADALVK